MAYSLVRASCRVLTPRCAIQTGVTPTFACHPLDPARYALPLQRLSGPAPQHPPIPLPKDLNILGLQPRKVDPVKHAPLSFDDTSVAFKHKTFWEMARALAVFKACSANVLVKNADRLLNLGKKVIGQRATMAIVQATFFAHFCAGTNSEDIKPRVNSLSAHGVSSILDFAAEADVPEEAKDQRNAELTHVDGHTARHQARVYDIKINNETCDQHVEIFKECIRAASQFEHGFAAIKVTALGQPALLERMTLIINRVRELFSKFDKNENRMIDFQEFKSTLEEMGVAHPNPKELFEQFDRDQSGYIDVFEWSEYLRVEDLATRPFFTKAHRTGDDALLPCLDEEETEDCVAMMERLNTLAELAAELKVRLMVDAEQTYFQPAIAHSVVNLQRRFNRDFPVVFNTYQCYLTNSLDHIKLDLLRAQKEGFYFAGKLVRGAYMVAERKRAKEHGYDDPIWPTIVDTHNAYDANLETILSYPHKANVMVASHNEDSVKLATSLMKAYDKDPKLGGVFFGQLLGMSDHLTYTLGHNGYQAFKYVPYGPVHEVIPYLLRRAQENSALLGSPAAKKEQALLRKELRKRVRNAMPFSH